MIFFDHSSTHQQVINELINLPSSLLAELVHVLKGTTCALCMVTGQHCSSYSASFSAMDAKVSHLSEYLMKA